LQTHGRHGRSIIAGIFEEAMGTSFRLLLPLIIGALLAACTSTQEPRPGMLPPAPGRQTDLTLLYDRMGHADETTGVSAAREAASGDSTERRFMASLWATRTRSAIGARRFADALSRSSLHQEALDWYERAYFQTENDDPMLPWLRYEMARECLELGRNEDALNLLANRMGTATLPPELAERYDALMLRASR
jgi:hypothetical protein